MSLSKKNRRAAKFLERKYDLSKFKGELIDITQFPEYSYLGGRDVYVKINNAGKITEMKQVSPSEINKMREEEEDKKILSDIIAGEKKEELKKSRKESQYQQKLREDKEFREDEYLKVKMDLQSTYAELISKDDSGYDPEDKITEAGSLNKKYYDLLNKVKIKERALQRKARAIEAAGDSTVYSDAVNTIKTLLGNDVNFFAPPPEEPKEDPSTPEKPIPDARKYYNPYTRSSVNSSVEPYKNPETEQIEQSDDLKTQPQPVPKILQPKKSTQDAKRKIEEEELNKLLGR